MAGRELSSTKLGLIIPDGDNITIARNLSGEYVWFAQAENPKDHCDISIIDG